MQKFFHLSLALFVICGAVGLCPAQDSSATNAAKKTLYFNLSYIDKANHRLWFADNLNTKQNTAKGLTILQRDAKDHDVVKYFAHAAKWSGKSWKLSGVLQINYAEDGSMKDQAFHQDLELPDITTPPDQLTHIRSDL